MPKLNNSQELTPDQRLAEIASTLTKTVARRRKEIKSPQRITDEVDRDHALAIFPETSVSVPEPAGEDREIGDDT